LSIYRSFATTTHDTIQKQTKCSRKQSLNIELLKFCNINFEMQFWCNN